MILRRIPIVLLALSSAALSLSTSAASPAESAAVPAKVHAQRHNMEQYAEKRLATLKEELKVTPSQEGAWQVFADTVKKQAAQRQAHWKDRSKEGASAEMTAPERIDRRIALMKEHLSGMEQMRDSFSTLYGQLTPEQKAVADKHASRMVDHHPRRHKDKMDKAPDRSVR